MKDTVELLGEVLRDAPRLPGAKCIGRADLFDPREPNTDPETVEYAQNAALRLCRSCPALASCSQWFDSLPPRHRPLGVIAGRLHP